MLVAPVVDIYIASLNRCRYIRRIMYQYYDVDMCSSHCLTPEKFPFAQPGDKSPMLEHVDQICDPNLTGKRTHLILVDDDLDNIRNAENRGYLVQWVDGCGMTDDTIQQLRTTIQKVPPNDQVGLLVDFDCTLTRMGRRGYAT